MQIAADERGQIVGEPVELVQLDLAAVVVVVPVEHRLRLGRGQIHAGAAQGGAELAGGDGSALIAIKVVEDLQVAHDLGELE